MVSLYYQLLIKHSKAIQKQNKARKWCSCSKRMNDDKKNKNNWLCCFEFCSWCCFDCLPGKFKVPSKLVYLCEICECEENEQ